MGRHWLIERRRWSNGSRAVEQAGGGTGSISIRFRLRSFVERLAAIGEMETKSGTTGLADVARSLEAKIQGSPV